MITLKIAACIVAGMTGLLAPQPGTNSSATAPAAAPANRPTPPMQYHVPHGDISAVFAAFRH